MSNLGLFAVTVDPRVARAGQLGDAVFFAVLAIIFAFYRSKKMPPRTVIFFRIFGTAAFGVMAVLKVLGCF